jgi:hypothetical protein
VTDPHDTTSRIAAAREHLSAKLAELRRRQASVVTALAPLRYLANPWLGIGIATVVGYRLGRPRVPAAPIEPVAIKPEGTLIRAIVRASVIMVAQTLVRNAITRLVDET